MGLWIDVLRILGLTKKITTRVRSRDIEVVISGEPAAVNQLVNIVKYELERRSLWSESGVRKLEGRTGRRRPPPPSNIVQPSELDDMDSPYAMMMSPPGPLAQVPDDAEETTSGEDERHGKRSKKRGGSSKRKRRRGEKQAEARQATPTPIDPIAPSLHMSVSTADSLADAPEDERTGIDPRPIPESISLQSGSLELSGTDSIPSSGTLEDALPSESSSSDSH